MTDFSFQNKAYDLLLNIKEDKIDTEKIESVGAFRLLMDINNSKKHFTIGNNLEQYEDKEDYRPIMDWEIGLKPTCKVKGYYQDWQGNKHEYYYHQTFTKIPYKETLIKNEYKFKLGDKISHICDKNSIGIIRDRLPQGIWNPILEPYKLTTNQYLITWLNTGTNKEIPLYNWYNEFSLIRKLEAKPMKTYTKRKITLQYNLFDPQQWLKEKISKGFDKATHLTLIQKNTEKREFGWVEKITSVIINDNAINTINSATNKLKHGYLKKYKDKDIKDITIVDDIPFYGKKKHKQQKKKLQQNQPKQPKDKLVNLKFITTGEIVRQKKSKAQPLVDRNGGMFVYTSKQEYRDYQKSLKSEPQINTSNSFINRSMKRLENRKHRNNGRVREQLIPIVKQAEKVTIKSMKPTLHEYDENNNIIGKTYFISKYTKPAYVAFKKVWHRVTTKLIKITDDILLQRKEQSQKDKMRYIEKSGKKSLEELIKLFAQDERRGDKYSERENWSKSFKQLTQLITSNRYIEGDKTINVNEKGLFWGVSHIINIKNKLHWDNEKINDFIRYIRLTTHGIFTKDKLFKEKKQKKQIEFEPVKYHTIYDVSKLKYDLPDEDKLIEFIFKNEENKETEGEGKLKENDILHESGDIICSVKDVVKWRYSDKDEYTQVLTGIEDAIKRIPIKWKRKK